MQKKSLSGGGQLGKLRSNVDSLLETQAGPDLLQWKRVLGPPAAQPPQHPQPKAKVKARQPRPAPILKVRAPVPAQRPIELDCPCIAAAKAGGKVPEGSKSWTQFCTCDPPAPGSSSSLGQRQGSGSSLAKPERAGSLKALSQNPRRVSVGLKGKDCGAGPGLAAAVPEGPLGGGEAPFELLVHFMESVMRKKYEVAFRLANKILEHEPENETVREYKPILTQLMELEDSEESEDSWCSDDSESVDSDADSSSSSSSSGSGTESSVSSGSSSASTASSPPSSRNSGSAQLEDEYASDYQDTDLGYASEPKPAQA